MRLMLPFLYEATVVMPRKRNQETVSLLGRVAIEVPEVAEADAPVAVRYRATTEAAEQVGWTVQDYRLTEFGGLCKPLRLDSLAKTPVAAVNAQVAFDAWAANCLRERERPVFPQDWLGPDRNHFRCPAFDEATFAPRRMGATTRQLMLNRLLAAAGPGGGLALIGGVLHVPSDGPCFVPRWTTVYVPGLQGRAIIRIDAMDEMANVPFRDRISIFGVERRADVRACATWMARDAGCGLDESRLAVIETLLPGGFRQRDDAFALIAATDSTLSSMSEIVGKLSPPDIIRYAHLKTAVEDARAEPDGPLAETLLPLLRDVDAAWGRHTGERHPGGASVNGLLAFERRTGGRDLEAEDIPEIGVDDLRNLGNPMPKR